MYIVLHAIRAKSLDDNREEFFLYSVLSFGYKKFLNI